MYIEYLYIYIILEIPYFIELFDTENMYYLYKII